MVMNLLGTVAQWEREIIGERTKAVLDHKSEIGEHVGRIPYGFAIGESGKVIENPEEIQNIRKMKREHHRGRSIREIADKYSLGKSTVQRLVMTDLRLLKNKMARN